MSKVELIKIKYKGKYPIMEHSIGDWIDLPVQESFEYKAGDTVFIKLGVCMEIPKGYEAIILPRSSTFKNTGLLLTNSMGVIDNSYCGDDDEWGAMFYATRDGSVEEGQRLLQFRIQQNQPKVLFENVLFLDNASRGGYGEGTGGWK